MEVTIAMGHFCEIHGPCVILCAQRAEKMPEELHPPLVFLYAMPTVAEEGKDKGTIFFGDTNNGHVISHVFTVKDSLARGFKRKYCFVVLDDHEGIKTEERDLDVLEVLSTASSKRFVLTTSGELCILSKSEGTWNVQFKGTLPKTLPIMFQRVEEALEMKLFQLLRFKYYLMSISMRWFNIGCVISWCNGPCDKLMKSLEVRKCDMPLLSYWIPQSHACVKINEKDWFHPD
ncbi:hypothetical protein NQ317_014079 [Molorchus minor]|uniref:UDENN FLCN/SMCR8-type domain-containing protein n=1 Tax=Molorchus minor TaxID=1323400 RepID=A0ABQ9JGU6_9CUCU|nr:hypothetical protein NQ317_014079 [Molorchus minor]